ncbi:MAG: DUF1573 domain-containing protein [Ferruginibacter sp.]
MKVFIVPLSALMLFAAGCDVRKKDKIVATAPDKENIQVNNPTTVQIIDSVYDFGQVTEGEIVSFNFRFKNTGTNPLVVSDVSASCGCTVPEKPEAPIRPGETGFIKAKFDTNKRPGEALKTVHVTSNSSPTFPELILKGKVLPKPANQ